MNLLQMTAMFAHVASRSISEAGNRNRPNAQRLVDYTNVPTLAGLVHFGFVIDAYAPRTWVVRSSPGHGRLRSGRSGLGTQCSLARVHGWFDPPQRQGSPISGDEFTQHMAEANRVPSVGTVGDSYGSALAETFNGQYMAEANHYTAVETL